MRLIFAFLIAALLTSHAVLGQFSTPVTTTFKTPYGNIPYRNYIHSASNNLYKNPEISRRYEFTIVFKNDSTQKLKAKINCNEKGVNFLEVRSNGVKNEIHPSETKSISRKVIDGWLSGIPADTCWLFNTKPGRINSYSFLAEPFTSLIIAVQKGVDSPIVALTKENLLAMVTDDAKASKLAQEDKLLRAIKRYNSRKE